MLCSAYINVQPCPYTKHNELTAISVSYILSSCTHASSHLLEEGITIPYTRNFHIEGSTVLSAVPSFIFIFLW
jgi:hypothetical protein